MCICAQVLAHCLVGYHFPFKHIKSSQSRYWHVGTEVAWNATLDVQYMSNEMPSCCKRDKWPNADPLVCSTSKAAFYMSHLLEDTKRVKLSCKLRLQLGVLLVESIWRLAIQRKLRLPGAKRCIVIETTLLAPLNRHRRPQKMDRNRVKVFVSSPRVRKCKYMLDIFIINVIKTYFPFYVGLRSPI